MMYRLKNSRQRPSPAIASQFLMSESTMRHQARAWHRANVDFAIGVLRSLGRCRNEAETAMAIRWHGEALDIGFWTKKDVVQYPLSCLHAEGSLVEVPSIRQFLDRFTDEDEDIMQKLIDAMPIHYWTYLRNKTANGRQPT